MLNRKFILKIFEGFSIQRWNDLVRPFELVEMDKAAEKMVLSYIIGKFEEDAGHYVDWKWIIYASLWDLLKKIALCDIKSPVQHMIRDSFPQEYIKLNEWVLDQYEPIIEDNEAFAMFKTYIGQTAGSLPIPDESVLASRVLDAAHKYSTIRELEMISCVNEKERIYKIRKELDAEIQEYLDLKGVQLLVTKQRPFDFLMKIEQLRFQTRWNQTQRVPKTSVLGHCFFVALFSLILVRSSKVDLCPKRLFNDFFCGLFHDLPEAVTRDIISPVKQATEELPSVVKNIENKIVEKELVPLMEDFYRDEILYFTTDEFENRILSNNLFGSLSSTSVSFEDINLKYNSDEFCPVDGKLVRLADHLSAVLEADSSIKYGISSSHLISGRFNTLQLYPDGTLISGIDAHKLLSSVCF